MNDEITAIVSRNFYERDGESLIASDFSRDRRLVINSEAADPAIRAILSSSDSFICHNATTDPHFEDANPEEAVFIADLVKEAVKSGMSTRDMAVITPYRRQVKTLRECIADRIDCELPLIDTVERLQGQDVDLIIISFSISSPAYFSTNQSFIYNPNRLNVMISRAKKKVLILGSDIVLKNLELLK